MEIVVGLMEVQQIAVAPEPLPPLRSGDNHSWISSGPLSSRINRGEIGDPLVNLVVHLCVHGARAWGKKGGPCGKYRKIK